ncbi:MAG: hypothetical protein WC824_02295 [Bacteroidota bacterium]|jgi:uncharacterized protein YoxC
MDLLQNILINILLVGGIVLVVVLIYILRSTRQTLETISGDIRRLSDEATLVFNQVQHFAEKATEALTVVSENRAKISAASENIRKVTQNIYRLENLLQEQVEPGLVSLMRTIAGVRHGIESFLESWRRRR